MQREWLAHLELQDHLELLDHLERKGIEESQEMLVR